MAPETIAVVVFPGVDELDAFGPYEVLANLPRAGIDVTVTLRTVDPATTVTGSHGITVEPDGVLDLAAVDLLVVPGGGWNDREGRGAWAEAQAGDLPDAIADAAEAGATVATVCTGGMLASTAGLTDGRPAVTHHGALDDLRDEGAEIVDARVVDDGSLVTAGGVTAGIDLAFWLIEREWGAGVASGIADAMEYERSDDVWRSGES